MGNELKQNRLFFVVILIIALEAVMFSAGNFKLNSAIKIEEERGNKIQTALQNLPIDAKAVSVYNVTKSKKIYGKNDDIPMPLASLAKTMTVVVALSNHKFNDIVYIPKGAISQAGDFGIFQDEKWYMSDLARATIISSANDGAYALTGTDTEFVNEMNAKARKLGMNNTSFLSPTGLDIDLVSPGGVISASDANTMAMFALRAYPQIFSVTTLPEINIVSLSGFNHNFKNTDTIISKIPNLLFSKTGYTTIAGGNLTVIFKDNRGEEIAITLLGSTYTSRFSDMENIINVLSRSD